MDDRKKIEECYRLMYEGMAYVVPSVAMQADGNCSIQEKVRTTGTEASGILRKETQRL